MKIRISLLVFLLLPLLSVSYGKSQLEKNFQNPPASARPHTWWHWVNGNITKEGIRADLEAMTDVGIGGAQIFNVGEESGSVDIPAGKIDYMSPEWLDMIEFAVKEAKRLGMELCFHNCAGWSCSGGPWITPEMSMQKLTWCDTAVSGDENVSSVKLAMPEVVAGYYRDIAILAFPTPKDNIYRINNWNGKAGFYNFQYNIGPEIVDTPADAIIDHKNIINLTSKLDSNNTLNWNVPKGSWTIVRIGHTSTGKTNHPAPNPGLGLECDKLNKAAVDLHWDKGVQPILDRIGKLAGPVLNNILIDSYEVGLNNWTQNMPQEFKTRCGYKLDKYLLALTGRVVDSSNDTERFLWDYRRTIADMFKDNYYEHFADKCHDRGILCSVEPYDGPFESLQVGTKADILMGEFWVGGFFFHSVKLASSIAHTHGQKYVGAESFTADPHNGKWQNHPGSLKMLGDRVWCAGVNRYIFHCYAHQPWMDKAPGMTMGQWGTHFGRTNTWWTQSKPWMKYIARSQFLLQQGNFVADVLFFAGENCPNNGTSINTELKKYGYDYDICGSDLLDKITVKNGLISLPNGMQYHLLVMPNEQYIRPALAKKMLKLANQGATIIGGRFDFSPSLKNYPQCDKVVKETAKLIWDSSDSAKIITDKTPLQVLQDMNIPGDCMTVNSSEPFEFIHRKTADTDIYFVSHQSDNSSEIMDMFFRVSGYQPELWNPLTGETVPAPIWKNVDGGTQISLNMGPAESIFVIFQKPAKNSIHADSISYNTIDALSSELDKLIPKQKLEILDAGYGVKDGNIDGMVDVTDKLNQLIKDNTLNVTVSNNIAGDPKPMEPKQLLVEYQYGSSTDSIRLNEGQTLSLPLANNESGLKLKITKAAYGIIPDLINTLPDFKVIDVTEIIRNSVIDNRLDIQLSNDLFGSDPVFGVPKNIYLHYKLNGKEVTKVLRENQYLTLPAVKWKPQGWLPETNGTKNTLKLTAWDNGSYKVHTTDGADNKISIYSIDDPIILNNKWTVDFTHGWGAPDQISLDKLISWTQHSDPGVRYYSGTAVYKTQLKLPAEFVKTADKLEIDLGNVGCIAEVYLNGKNVGIAWRNPYRIDITKAAKKGNNKLEIHVTNLWPNRLIGDEQYPDDYNWSGDHMEQWPDWILNNTPRTVKERLTFKTWNHWSKDDSLIPSGLMGPVYIRQAKTEKITIK